jgi:hypothetical protein
MALQAGAGLLLLGHALGLALVGEHVGVAALLAVVDREGVAVEERAQQRVAVELLDVLAAAVVRALDVDGALVGVVLAREALAPLGRVGGRLDGARRRTLSRARAGR